MAKLDNDSRLLQFAAATTAITLTTSRKLIRNFRYYKNRSDDRIEREELSSLCRYARQDAFGLQNLMINGADTDSPFLVSLAGEIYDRLEELHRKLLFFEADSITDIIPLVDEQRRFWKQLTQSDFYSDNLIRELEGPVPNTFETIEQLIHKLPAYTTG